MVATFIIQHAWPVVKHYFQINFGMEIAIAKIVPKIISIYLHLGVAMLPGLLYYVISLNETGQKNVCTNCITEWQNRTGFLLKLRHGQRGSSCNDAQGRMGNMEVLPPESRDH